jgi:hypothetical protein
MVIKVLQNIEDGILKQIPNERCPKCRKMSLWEFQGLRDKPTILCSRCDYEKGDKPYY